MRLRKGMAWVSLGSMAIAASQCGVTLGLVKLSNASVVGAFALGIAITTPVVAFSGFQLRSIVSTDVTEQYGLPEYLGFRLASVSIAMALILSIALVSYGGAPGLVITFTGLAKCVDSVSEVFHGYLLRRDRTDRMAFSQCMHGFLSLGVLLLGFSLTGSLVAATALWALVQICILLLYDLPSTVNTAGRSVWSCPGEQTLWHDVVRPRFDLRKCGSLFRLVLPMGIIVFLTALSANVPRYFIEHYAGVKALGIFSALNLVAGSSLVGALSQPFQPKLAYYYSVGGPRQFLRLFWRMMALCALVGVLSAGVLIRLGHWILTVMFSAEYAAYYPAYVVLALFYVVSYLNSFLGNSLTAVRYLNVQVPINCMILLASAPLSLLLIPSGGLLAAARVLLICETLLLLCNCGVMVHACLGHNARVRVRQDAVMAD